MISLSISVFGNENENQIRKRQVLRIKLMWKNKRQKQKSGKSTQNMENTIEGTKNKNRISNHINIDCAMQPKCTRSKRSDIRQYVPD